MRQAVRSNCGKSGNKGNPGADHHFRIRDPILNLEQGQSLQIDSLQVNRPPPALRCYVGCASKLYGDVQNTHMVKIHPRTGPSTVNACNAPRAAAIHSDCREPSAACGNQSPTLWALCSNWDSGVPRARQFNNKAIKIRLHWSADYWLIGQLLRWFIPWSPFCNSALKGVRNQSTDFFAL